MRIICISLGIIKNERNETQQKRSHEDIINLSSIRYLSFFVQSIINQAEFDE